jgi:eukaryotic-like serine/threonine-protein kinase
VVLPAILPGTLVASRWIVGGILGKSELAIVYEAEEARQSRFAALKFFDPSLASGPEWSEHVAVTQALSELPGDGIARAYDCGIDPVLGRPYVASERLVFPTLARYVAEKGPISPKAFAECLETLTTALDTAHAAGIVHANLKPHNVFLSVENPRWARLTDFCVGRLRGTAHSGPGAMLGWSAPEASAGFATPASDRYALGLLTFFALVGSPWHSVLRGGDAKTPDSTGSLRIASKRASALGGKLDPALDAWFERALGADPAARFESSRRMLQGFVEALWGGATLEAPARSAGVGAVRIAEAQNAGPLSLPQAGPAYWSTLEMPKPGPIVTDPTQLATAATDPVPKQRKLSQPLAWRLGIAGIALVVLSLVYWLLRR